MEASHLDKFALLLHDWAGQWFPESRRGDLERAFNRSLDKYGNGADAAAFLARLEYSAPEALKNSIIQEILVGETYFFRDAILWNTLRDEIIPELSANTSKKVKIWSAGCSTGEEPYSLALMFNKYMPAASGWDVSILATDISEISLSKAKTGIYGRRAIRDLDRELWGKWFDFYENSVQISHALRLMVKFSRQNLSLLDFPSPVTAGCDLIFCRNVLIYLDRELVLNIIRHFGQCLAPGGRIILAPTEIPLDPPEGLRIVQMKSGLMTICQDDNKTASSHSNRADDYGYSFTSRSGETNFKNSNLNAGFTSQSPSFTSVENSQPSFAFQAPNRNTSEDISFSYPLFSAPKTKEMTAVEQSKAHAADLAHRSSTAGPSLFTHTSSASSEEPLSSNTSDLRYSSESISAPKPQDNFTGNALAQAAADNNADLLVRQARDLMEAGNFAAAKLKATQSLETSPTFVKGWMVLAAIQEQMDQPDDALESLSKATYLAPDLAAAYLGTARLRARLGLPGVNVAISNFEKLTSKMRPDSALPESFGLRVGDARAMIGQIMKNPRRGDR